MDKTGRQLFLSYFLVFLILSPWCTNDVLGSIIQINPYHEIFQHGLEILENKCSTGNSSDSGVKTQKVHNCVATIFGTDKFEKSESIPDVSVIVDEICQSVTNSTKSTCMVDHRQIIQSCPKPETQDFNQILRKICEVGFEEEKKKSLLYRFFQKSGLECLHQISGSFDACTLQMRNSYRQNPQVYTNGTNCEFIKKSLDCLYNGLYTCMNLELIGIMDEVRQFMAKSYTTNSPNCYLSGTKSLQCCSGMLECNALTNCRAEVGCCSAHNCDTRDECNSMNSTTLCCPDGGGCNPSPNCKPDKGCCQEKDMTNCNSDPNCLDFARAGAFAVFGPSGLVFVLGLLCSLFVKI